MSGGTRRALRGERRTTVLRSRASPTRGENVLREATGLAPAGRRSAQATPLRVSTVRHRCAQEAASHCQEQRQEADCVPSPLRRSASEQMAGRAGGEWRRRVRRGDAIGRTANRDDCDRGHGTLERPQLAAAWRSRARSRDGSRARAHATREMCYGGRAIADRGRQPVRLGRHDQEAWEPRALDDAEEDRIAPTTRSSATTRRR